MNLRHFYADRDDIIPSMSLLTATDINLWKKPNNLSITISLCHRPGWAPAPLEKIAKKSSSVEKYPKISAPLANYLMILSPLEIEWEILYSEIIPTRIFELETIYLLSPLEFNRNFNPHWGIKFHRCRRQGCMTPLLPRLLRLNGYKNQDYSEMFALNLWVVRKEAS